MDFTEGIAYTKDQEIAFLRERVDKLEEDNQNLAGALVIANSKLAQIHGISR